MTPAELQDIVVEALKADDIWTFARAMYPEDAGTEHVRGAIIELRRTADALVGLGESIKRDIDHATEYVTGGFGHFNSLGVLQSRGPEYDVLCARFADRVERVKTEAQRYDEALPGSQS